MPELYAQTPPVSLDRRDALLPIRDTGAAALTAVPVLDGLI